MILLNTPRLSIAGLAPAFLSSTCKGAAYE